MILLALVLVPPTSCAQLPNDGRPCGYTGDGHIIANNLGRCTDNVAVAEIDGC